MISCDHIEIFLTAKSAIRVLLTIEINVNQSSCYKITFFQVHTQALLHILSCNVQLIFGKNRFGQQLSYYRQQLLYMFCKAVKCKSSGFAVTTPVEIRTVIFKMLIYLKC